jgi:hypothetical protein
VLASGIWFANGIALSSDESYIALAETLGSRLLPPVAHSDNKESGKGRAAEAEILWRMVVMIDPTDVHSLLGERS